MSPLQCPREARPPSRNVGVWVVGRRGLLRGAPGAGAPGVVGIEVEVAAIPDVVVNTPMWLALLTTGVGACEGAIIGRRRDRLTTDLVGTFVFALFLGLGGGIARDLMIGNTPLVALRSPWYLVTVAVVVVVTLIVGRWISVESTMFVVLDALTLALYAAIGTQYALDFQVSLAGAVLVGLFASLTGGVVVSLLRREVPAILVPGSPYALWALAGVLTYLLLVQVNGVVASLVCIIVVVVGRVLTLHWDVRTPAVPDLSRG